MAFNFQEMNLPRPPRLPAPPQEYDPKYFDDLNRTLLLYFNQLDNAVRALLQNVPPVP